MQTPFPFCLDFMYTPICSEMNFTLVLVIVEKVLRSLELFGASITTCKSLCANTGVKFKVLRFRLPCACAQPKKFPV